MPEESRGRDSGLGFSSHFSRWTVNQGSECICDKTGWIWERPIFKEWAEEKLLREAEKKQMIKWETDAWPAVSNRVVRLKETGTEKCPLELAVWMSLVAFFRATSVG